MEPTFYISSEFELKVYLFALVELKMAANYITKGILYIVSDILSMITVALCMVQKVPQIRELYTYKSAKGRFFIFYYFFSINLEPNTSGYCLLNTPISIDSLILNLFFE